MDFLKTYSDMDLCRFLEHSQASLVVISMDIGWNSKTFQKAGKKYRPDKEMLASIDERIQRTINAFGEVRARNFERAEWKRQGLPNVPRQINPKIVSLVHYHPAIQKRFLRHLLGRGDAISENWAKEERGRISKAKRERLSAKIPDFRRRK